MQTTLTSKAQITLPKGIRTLLQLEPGDKVDFVPHPDGRVTVAKVSKTSHASFASLRGLLPKPQRAFSIKEMNQAVLDQVAELDNATKSSINLKTRKHAGA